MKSKTNMGCFILTLALCLFLSISSNAQTNQQLIEQGRKLFSGQMRLTNRGPSCISCHHMKDQELAIGGGLYALELTPIYGTFGEEATRNFIANSPFLVMAAAYDKRPVTPEEVDKLLAYMQYVSATNKDAKEAGAQPFSTNNSVLWAGIIGLCIILMAIWLKWRSRKKYSVNHAIYQRQITSS